MSDDKARKAAEDEAKNGPWEIDEEKAAAKEGFMKGVAWARENPEWKCPPEYPNEGDVIVIKKLDDEDSWTYHISRSRRSIPIMSSWMLIEALPPAPGEE